MLSQQTLRLAAFGKLPIARDFVWSNVERGAGRRMRELLEGGASAIRGEAAASGVRAYFRSSEGWAVTTAWESSDAGGLRAFPFGLGCAVENFGAREPLARTRPIHEWHRSVFEEAKRLGNIEGFEEGINKTWAVGVSAVRAPTGDLRGNGWSAQLRAAFDQDEEHMGMALWRLRLLLEAGGRDLATLVPARQGVVVPLGTGDGWEGLADLWWDALKNSLLRMEGFPEAILCGGREPFGAFLFRALQPEDLRVLTQQGAPGVIDLRRASRPSSLHGFSEFRERLGATFLAKAPEEWLDLMGSSSPDQIRKGQGTR